MNKHIALSKKPMEELGFGVLKHLQTTVWLDVVNLLNKQEDRLLTTKK